MNYFIILRESLQFAAQTVKANPIRTLLSSFGLIIGVVCIVGIFTFIDAFKNEVTRTFSEMLGGTEQKLRIDKWPWEGNRNYPWWKYIRRPHPDFKDFSYLKNKSDYAHAIAIFSAARGRVVRYQSNRTIASFVWGVSHAYQEINPLSIEKGRFFGEIEMQQDYIIIGSDIAKNLALPPQPVGKRLNLFGRKFTIIGVLKRSGEGFAGISSPDEVIYMPYKAFRRAYNSGGRRGSYTSIVLKGRDDDVGLHMLESEVRTLLRIKRNIKPGEEDNFAINKLERLNAQIASFTAILNIIGLVIASFSILIGAFNIANIMFVSVKERTFQIGLQKSVGATKSFIITQFILEAIFLTFIGGAIGIGIVYALTFISIGNMVFVLSAKNILVGVLVCTITGLIAGTAPAYQAARLDPIKALRS